MSRELELISVNLSQSKGTIKRPVERITIDLSGVVGDAHAGPWQRQVSLLSQDGIERFSEKLGRRIMPGEFAENLTVAGLDFAAVAVLDRFRFGGVELEVTQIGKQCHGRGCTIFQEIGQCVMPAEGIFTRVVSGGELAAGDARRMDAPARDTRRSTPGEASPRIGPAHESPAARRTDREPRHTSTTPCSTSTETRSSSTPTWNLVPTTVMTYGPAETANLAPGA